MPEDSVPLSSLFGPAPGPGPGPEVGPGDAGLPTSPIPQVDLEHPVGAELSTGAGAPTFGRGPKVLAGVVVAVLVVALAAFVVPRLNKPEDPRPQALATTPTQTPTVDATTAEPTPSPTETHAPTRAKLAIKSRFVAAGPAPHLPWPSSGQARVEIPGIGTIGRSGGSGPVPIASITKVMTAYTVLRDHPLGAGQSGPTITVSEAEAAKYEQQRANGESVVVVEAGEKITLRDALKGLLVASGGNLAEILARWDAGSESAFVARMNANARRLGMSSTRYADVSGLSPKSMSTAADLIKLAPVAMAEPALARTVGMATASIPLNPSMSNYNSLLGLHGVYGIKTGSTTAAGGCLLFAARKKVAGRTETIYGAVLGIDGDRSSILSNARDASDALVVGAGDSLHRIIVLRAGAPVARLYDRQGQPVTLTVAKTLAVNGWSGQRFRFALPTTGAGRIPKTITVHTPNTTVTVKLVAI